ncbi:MAG TPA: hypothetical protein VEU47_13315 [Candidatus Cybelea sp.]|nr:hypothetical protein [Candidatus Cybelea sp.]
MEHARKDEPNAAATPDVEQLMKDIASLRREFSNLVDHMKAGASDTARASAEQLGDRARVVYDKLAADADRSAKAIARQVEEQPLLSLLIAFAVGFVASRLLSR